MNILTDIVDYTAKLPLGVVAMLFAVALGYLLKMAAFFPNNRIPVVVVPFTALIFTILNLCEDLMTANEHPYLRLPLFFTYGFIYGFAAWVLHARILKAWLDPKLFNADGTSRFFKSNPPEPPAQPSKP